MSCLTRIYEAQESFTETERKIADYIVTHQEMVLVSSVQVLAVKTKTSAAAITRFAKTLGYKGLPALKLDLALDTKDMRQDLTDSIESSDSYELIAKKTYQYHLDSIKKIYDLVDINALTQSVDALERAHRIFLFGVGSSGNVCNDFYHKLTRLGYPVNFHPDTHIQLSSVGNITPDDVAIAISYSGETRDILVPIRHALKINATTIGISQIGKNSLAKEVDISFSLPRQEGSLRIGAIASRDTSLYVCDLIYLCLAKKDLPETIKKLEMTRELVSKLQGGK